MKKAILLLAAVASLMAATACGMKKTADETEAESGAAVPDALMNEQAVAERVRSVYQYLNDIRQYYLDTPVDEIEDGKWAPADERFSTREWRSLRHAVDSIGMANDNGSFYDFGDHGPLDPWQYDCFEGALTVDDIRVRLLTDGTAQADFNLRDAMTIGSVPMRWVLRVEDGEWRVADIIFVKENNYQLLKGMKEYVAEN